MSGEPMTRPMTRDELLVEVAALRTALAAAAARAVRMEDLVREMAAYACDRVATGYEPVQSRGCGRCLACRARALRAHAAPGVGAA